MIFFEAYKEAADLFFKNGYYFEYIGNYEEIQEKTIEIEQNIMESMLKCDGFIDRIDVKLTEMIRKGIFDKGHFSKIMGILEALPEKVKEQQKYKKQKNFHPAHQHQLK